jgi:hypothetical protein
MEQPTINYVTRANVRVEKWDACIANASNGLIYAHSFYLDKMAKHWDALVLGEYEAVMPLTWNRKASIYYLYQPAFTPNLGVFGRRLEGETVSHFIRAIPNRFRLIEISLNCGNEYTHASLHREQAMHRNNYVLSLHKTYDELYSGYNENIKRNIKKSVSFGCKAKSQIPIDEIIHLSKKQLSHVTNLEERDYQQFKSLFVELEKRQQAKTYGVYLNDQLISSAVFFFGNGRAYYILVGNHPNGKTLGASHYLIDRFITDHAQQNLLLDFEGSDISSLAFFYSSFGAKPEHYPALRINRLPWFIRWLK